MSRAPTTTAEKAVPIAAIGVALGAFLPWVSLFGISVSGVKKDGALTLGIAVIGLLVFAVHRLARRPARGTMLAMEIAAGALVTLIALIDMNGLAAGGLYLTLLSGIGWAVAAFTERLARTLLKAPDHPTPLTRRRHRLAIGH